MKARRTLIIALAGGALLLIGAGLAQADSNDSDNTGYPSTQSDTQGADAATATAHGTDDSFGDAANGDHRPDDANGTDTQFPQPDPRFVEGPAGGLAKNGPLG
ncbi:MAG TPA: hypothetical protein VFE65_06170 [Pseudonocardia sp.]|jgi:hypothetical protein|nr:hypothetical protein [Pseudonocardia sp.]